MKISYEELWSQLVRHIQEGNGDKAKAIWDKVVELAWMYEDLSE